MILGKDHLTRYDTVIVGAGAAGLIASWQASQSGGKVLLIEKMPKPGRKLLITGKGRCNITNNAGLQVFFDHIHPKPRFLKYAFSQFFSNDIIELLNKNGTPTIIERGGRVFPASEKSVDVLKVLTGLLKRNNVTMWYNCTANNVLIDNNHVTGLEVVKNHETVQINASKVIICTGGKSYPATGSTGDGYKLAESLGHTLTPLKPALVPLVTAGNMAKEMQGLSLKNANATIWINGKKGGEAFGELLFTHFGLSGPIILTLSRRVVKAIDNNDQVEIGIDLKPALDDKKLDNRLLRDLETNNKKRFENICKQWVPLKMVPVLIRSTGIDPNKEGNNISSKERKRIRLFLKQLSFKISGYRPIKEAIITSGGIPTTEIDSRTMQSKIINNLYFAGEVIDLDGDTGGYNLQIAFSTGFLAGRG